MKLMAIAIDMAALHSGSSQFAAAATDTTMRPNSLWFASAPEANTAVRGLA